MIAPEALAAVGLDHDHLMRARAGGVVVGRGEGFVTREWRPGGGAVVVVHNDASEQTLVCAQPMLAGLPWEPWTLTAIREEASCPHCAKVQVQSGSLSLWAYLPDFAARRRMWPLGLEVRAQVLVAATDWTASVEAPPSLIDVDGRPGGVVLAGRAQDVARFTDEVTGLTRTRSLVDVGGRTVTVAGVAPEGLQPGAPTYVSGWAVVRIGAPLKVRGA